MVIFARSRVVVERIGLISKNVKVCIRLLVGDLV